MHTKTNNRRVIAFVTAKLMAVLALVGAFQKVLSSSLLEEWSGYDFIQPSGMNVASIDWLMILIFLFVLATYRYYREEDIQMPPLRQMAVSFFLLLITLAGVFILVHPSDTTFNEMAAFIIRHRVVGGPIMGSYLSSLMTLMVVPLMYFFFPMHFFRTYRWKLLFGFLGLQMCFFVTVPEALYHAFFNPYLLKTVLAMTHLFLKNVSSDPAKSILTANTFIVRVGPACSGLSFIILFISFFSYVLMSFSRSGQIVKYRAAIIFLFGIIALFFLNAIRITSIMLVGTVAPHLAMNLFHSAVGAVIFFIFFLLFLPVMRRWVVVPHGRHHAS